MSNWFRFGHLVQAMIKWLLCNNIEHFICGLFIIVTGKRTVTIERFNIEYCNSAHKWANILHIVRIAVQTSFHIHFSQILKFQWQRWTWGIFVFFRNESKDGLLFVIFVSRPYTKVWYKQFKSIFVVFNFSHDCDIFPVGCSVWHFSKNFTPEYIER